MKKLVLILSILLVINILMLITIIISNRELRVERNYLIESRERYVQKELLKNKIMTTRTMLKVYNEKPFEKTSSQIQIKYEKIIDTILILPDSIKWSWANRELDKLFPNR